MKGSFIRLHLCALEINTKGQEKSQKGSK